MSITTHNTNIHTMWEGGGGAVMQGRKLSLRIVKRRYSTVSEYLHDLKTHARKHGRDILHSMGPIFVKRRIMFSPLPLPTPSACS